MKFKSIFLCTCLLIMSSSFLSCSKDDNDDIIPIRKNEQSAVLEIIDLLNDHRISLSLEPFEINTFAEQLAVEHVNLMIDKEEVNYDGYDVRIDALREKENAAGIGEFNAKSYEPAEIVELWLNTDFNKGYIEGEYSHIGIGAVKDEGGTYYYTALIFRKRD